MFPVAIALTEQTTPDTLQWALEHWLDTVVVPVDQNNWRRIRSLMNFVRENGWGLRFVLWAKGQRVKSVPLHYFAQHPCLLGWVVQDISETGLLAMLRATTERGMVWAWQVPLPFTKGTLSSNPVDRSWWAWVSATEPEKLLSQIARALLRGSQGVCFSSLPASESEAAEREQLKALATFALHLRLWQPLLSSLPQEIVGWDWREEDWVGRIWEIGEREWVCVLAFRIAAADISLRLPFLVPEGVRAYGVQFPALVRLPMQRKGAQMLIRWSSPSPLTLLWLTDAVEKVQRMHQHTNELLPKAMQFSVQWVLARQDRLKQQGMSLPDIPQSVWEMLQKTKRRQLSHAYLLAQKLLTTLGALPLELEGL